MKEWTNVIGKKSEIPTFEQITKNPEQLMRFTAMVKSVTDSCGGYDDMSTDLVVHIAPGLQRTVGATDRPYVVSALRKLATNTVAPVPGTKAPAKAPEALAQLTSDEVRSLAPLFEKFSRATAALDAFQGRDRFTDVEMRSIVNWASQHSPELAGIMAQVGNRPDFFMRALKTLAYAPNPESFLLLRTQLETARNIAIRQAPLHERLAELGKEHGIAVQDMVAAIDGARSPAEARRELLRLIEPSFAGKGLFSGLGARMNARWAVSRFNLHLGWRRSTFASRREERREVLAGDPTVGDSGIAASLLRMIEGTLDPASGTRTEGLLASDFAQELAGAKGSPDYSDAQTGFRAAAERVRATDDAAFAGMVDTQAKRLALGIDDPTWDARNDADPALNTSDAIADIMLERRSQDEYAKTSADPARGFWHRIVSGTIDIFKGIFFSEAQKTALRSKIRTMP